MHKLTAEEPDIGKRADVFVAEKLKSYSRASLKNIFSQKNVFNNGIPVKSGYKLKFGDELSIDTKSLDLKPPAISLPVIFENDDVVVINKPSGILTHAKGAVNDEPTVASFISDKIIDKDLSGNRAGIVHRLDRLTSGVMIAAKNQKTQKFLQEQFSKRKVDKTYIAIIEGEPVETEAIIDMPIDRNPKNRQKFITHPKGKAAQTKYAVQKTFKNQNKIYSRLEIKPITGRTNQIRVHLAAIGQPIVGDSVYGHDNKTGLMLHAASIKINLPEIGQKTFEAELPPKFNDFQNKF